MPIFAPPAGPEVPIARPLLASWDSKTHPRQIALQQYLKTLETALHLEPAAHGLAIALCVAMPESRSLTSGGGDLDNYLLPILRRLGHHRFAAAFATKRVGERSSIRVADAEPAGFTRQPDLTVHLGPAPDSRRWKETLRDYVGAPLARGDGPVALDICFRVHPNRDWTALWKPSIDALGGLLGLASAGNPFSSKDDRIVRLGLHRNVDDAVGWDIGLELWWAEVPSSDLANH